MSSDPIRLLVADDQTAIREALALMMSMTPGIDVVGTAADGEQAVALVEEHRPKVVLMDLRMPGMDGIAATSLITQRFPTVAVVVLTTFDDEASILAALGAGARGYLTKEAGRDDIARAVITAAAGQSVLDPAVQARLVAAATGVAAGAAVSSAASSRSPTASSSTVANREDAAAFDDLSPREREVLALIAAGKTNRDIAGALFVSEATVKTHVNNIFTKTGLKTRAQAVHYAFTHGLV